MPSDGNTAVQSLQAKADTPSSAAMSEALQVLHTAADPRVYVRLVVSCLIFVPCC